VDKVFGIPNEKYFIERDSDDTIEYSDCIWWLQADHMFVRVCEAISLAVIILSVVNFIVQTLPAYRLDSQGEEKGDEYDSPFFIIESFCIAWFTIEFLMRLFAANFRWSFWKQYLNIVDVVVILPYYISFGVVGGNVSSLAILRILRLSRVVRLFKLSQHNTALNDMLVCFGRTGPGLVLFVIVIVLSAVLLGSAVFYAELDAFDGQFYSIPIGMWWTVVTITTVGYGDIVPVGTAGLFVGSITATFGIVLIAIPASIFITSFMRMHDEKKRQAQGNIPSMRMAFMRVDAQLRLHTAHLRVL
jgi:voltage-gated potassium channel Kch